MEKENLQLHLKTILHAKVETAFGYRIAVGTLWKDGLDERSASGGCSRLFSTESFTCQFREPDLMAAAVLDCKFGKGPLVTTSHGTTKWPR